jgi:hypothetical protein
MVVADPAGTFVYADSSGNARAAFFSAAIRRAHPAGHETTAVPVDAPVPGETTMGLFCSAASRGLRLKLTRKFLYR